MTSKTLKGHNLELSERCLSMRFFGSGFLNKPNINLPNRLLGDFGFIQNFAEIFGIGSLCACSECAYSICIVSLCTCSISTYCSYTLAQYRNIVNMHKLSIFKLKLLSDGKIVLTLS
jgi:hypothetical protein